MPVAFGEQDIRDRALLDRWKESRQERLREQLLARFRPLVKDSMRRICNRREITDRDMQSDLESEGLRGLLAAFESFSPSAGTSLDTWCGQKVRSYIYNCWLDRPEPFIAPASELFETEEAFHDSYRDDLDSDDDKYEDEQYDDEVYDDPFADPTPRQVASEYDWEKAVKATEETRLRHLRYKIAKLPDDGERLREIATMFHIDGKSQLAIAATIGKSQPTISLRLKKIEQLFEPRYNPREPVVLGDECGRRWTPEERRKFDARLERIDAALQKSRIEAAKARAEKAKRQKAERTTADEILIDHLRNLYGSCSRDFPFRDR